MTKQKTLNGKTVSDIWAMSKTLEGIGDTLRSIESMLREFLGSKPAVFQGSTQPLSSLPPPQAEELSPIPAEVLAQLKVEGNAYRALQVDERGYCDKTLYGEMKKRGYAYSPNKHIFWKPKERR